MKVIYHIDVLKICRAASYATLTGCFSGIFHIGNVSNFAYPTLLRACTRDRADKDTSQVSAAGRRCHYDERSRRGNIRILAVSFVADYSVYIGRIALGLGMYIYLSPLLSSFFLYISACACPSYCVMTTLLIYISRALKLSISLNTSEP